jgi:anti-anti-sigma factor
MPVAEPFRSDPPPFEIVLVREPGRMLVVPEGELDLATAGDLRRAVMDLSADGTESVVLDLSRLQFVDSCQIHLLVELEVAAALDGFAFAVRLGDATPARRLMALTGLEERSRERGVCPLSGRADLPR